MRDERANMSEITMVTVRRIDGSKFEVVSGILRFMAALDVLGSVMVRDAGTGQTFKVVKRDGELIEAEPDSQAQTLTWPERWLQQSNGPKR
jgi:hypothetical protein